MRLAIILAALGLAGCSAEPVKSIGFHQYEVTASGRKTATQAAQTCEKLGRELVPLAMPQGSPPDRFRFECLNSYEIVPLDAGSYRIRVLASDIQVKHHVVPASQDRPAETVWTPDKEPVHAQAIQRATEYCAKTTQDMKVTGDTFDASAGLEIVFQCTRQAAGGR